MLVPTSRYGWCFTGAISLQVDTIAYIFRIALPVPCKVRRSRLDRTLTCTSALNLRMFSRAVTKSSRNLADLHHRNQLDRHRSSSPSTKMRHLQDVSMLGQRGSEDRDGTYLNRIRPNSFMCSSESSGRPRSSPWTSFIDSKRSGSWSRYSLSEARIPSVVQLGQICAMMYNTDLNRKAVKVNQNVLVLEI